MANLKFLSGRILGLASKVGRGVLSEIRAADVFKTARPPTGEAVADESFAACWEIHKQRSADREKKR